MKVLLVQWDETAAAKRAERLRGRGLEVTLECRDGAEAYRKARQGRPDVVVLDLDHKPSHSWQTARPLTKSAGAPRLVFVGGDADTRSRAAQHVPAATFVDPDQLESALV